MQDCIVETLPIEMDKKEYKELILTNLNSYSLPFVRYKVGDIGEIEKSKCSCGLPNYRIVNLIGRTRDVIRVDNKIYHGSFFNQVFYNYPDIRQYQVIQNGDNIIQILIDTHKSGSELEIFVEKIRKDLGAKMNLPGTYFKISLNRDFILNQSMKFRNIISNVH